MGWFSGIGDALSGIGSFVDKNASWLVPAATTAIGAITSTNANDAALQAQLDAQKAAQEDNSKSQEAARAELAASKQRGIRAIQTGTQGYRQTVLPMLQADYGPTGLTDTQSYQLDDLTRSGNASLAASGLRGAGRAGPLSVMESRGRYMAGALDTNQQRQDTTRRGLAGVYADEGRSIANTEIGTGTQTAGSLQSEGSTNANLALQGGEAAGNAATANGTVASTALGRIGAIADDQVTRTGFDQYGRPINKYGATVQA